MVGITQVTLDSQVMFSAFVLFSDMVGITQVTPDSQPINERSMFSPREHSLRSRSNDKVRQKTAGAHVTSNWR
ncbi:hypothetical protein J6590_031256 [Homalodisca vitripennis]|nr:hypothetical protein J6590_031256 [Homalodisca vitripennis]